MGWRSRHITVSEQMNASSGTVAYSLRRTAVSASSARMANPSPVPDMLAIVVCAGLPAQRRPSYRPHRPRIGAEWRGLLRSRHFGQRCGVHPEPGTAVTAMRVPMVTGSHGGPRLTEVETDPWAAPDRMADLPVAASVGRCRFVEPPVDVVGGEDHLTSCGSPGCQEYSFCCPPGRGRLFGGWMGRSYLSVPLTQDEETAPEAGAVGPRLLTWAGYGPSLPERFPPTGGASGAGEGLRGRLQPLPRS